MYRKLGIDKRTTETLSMCRTCLEVKGRTLIEGRQRMWLTADFVKRMGWARREGRHPSVVTG